MALDHVIRAHGFLAVLLALTLRPFRPSQPARGADIAGLSDHMLRDIGQETPPPAQPTPQHLVHMAMMRHGTR